MEVRSYNGVFIYFKQFNFDEVYQKIGLKKEYADWLFHIIHNDFDEKYLAQKFDIDEHEALIFLEVSGEYLRDLMREMESDRDSN